MNLDEINRKFLRLEAETGAFDLVIDGVPVWERIRFDTHRQVIQKMGKWEVDEPTDKSQARRRFQRLRMGMRNLVHRNPFLSESHDTLYWGHRRRKKQSDGYWWDIYCDPLHEQLPNQDFLHVELPHGSQHYTPPKTSPLRYLDLIQVTVGVAKSLGVVDYSFSRATKERIGRLSAAFESGFSLDLDIEKAIRNMLTERSGLRPLYCRFLKRVNPEVVVLVVHNGKETFIEVCKEMDIPVVELQHGIITEYEYAYSYPGFRNKQAFPDYLFTWGEFWSDGIELPIENNRVVPVGYPYIETAAEKYMDIEVSNQIVFISQPNIGKEFSKIACEVSNNPEINSKIIYKLHPYEYEVWKTRYPWLTDSSVNVIHSNDPPLYELFARSKGQVGVFSTAIYEGLRFGLDTYLYDLPGVENLSHLYNSGLGELAETTEQLCNQLCRLQPDSIDHTRFFASNAVENFSKHLDQVRTDAG